MVRLSDFSFLLVQILAMNLQLHVNIFLLGELDCLRCKMRSEKEKEQKEIGRAPCRERVSTVV